MCEKSLYEDQGVTKSRDGVVAVYLGGLSSGGRHPSHGTDTSALLREPELPNLARVRVEVGGVAPKEAEEFPVIPFRPGIGLLSRRQRCSPHHCSVGSDSDKIRKWMPCLDTIGTVHPIQRDDAIVSVGQLDGVNRQATANVTPPHHLTITGDLDVAVDHLVGDSWHHTDHAPAPSDIAVPDVRVTQGINLQSEIRDVGSLTTSLALLPVRAEAPPQGIDSFL